MVEVTPGNFVPNFHYRYLSEDIPYGLRISEDCKRLEVDEAENKVLLMMMDLLAQDFSY